MMWRFKLDLLGYLLWMTTFILFFPSSISGGSIKIKNPCDVSSVDNGCGPNERCIQDAIEGLSTYCACQQGYESNTDGVCTKSTRFDDRVDEQTIQPDSGSRTTAGGSSVTAFLVVPTCLVIIGALIYFGARRYKWLQRFRQFRQNRYGSVLVTRDDTDDDDPPLA